MNRSTATDSKLSLNADRRISNSAEMITQPYHLYVERTDVTRNMARYYAMEISMTLFGEACLTRSWGRIGKSGQRMTHHFKREEEAVDLFLDLLRQKRAKGYRAAGPETGEKRPRKRKIV
jgi:predicted DNA-binding WGR domain protein